MDKKNMNIINPNLYKKCYAIILLKIMTVVININVCMLTH